MSIALCYASIWFYTAYQLRYLMSISALSLHVHCLNVMLISDFSLNGQYFTLCKFSSLSQHVHCMSFATRHASIWFVNECPLRYVLSLSGLSQHVLCLTSFQYLVCHCMPIFVRLASIRLVTSGFLLYVMSVCGLSLHFY